MLPGPSCRSHGKPTALHGDFYLDNLLLGDHRWLAIDRKPCFGDLAFDAGTWAYAALRGREAATFAGVISDELNISASRILGWAAVIASTNLVFRTAWNHAEDGEFESTVDFIEDQLVEWRV